MLANWTISQMLIYKETFMFNFFVLCFEMVGNVTTTKQNNSKFNILCLWYIVEFEYLLTYLKDIS